MRPHGRAAKVVEFRDPFRCVVRHAVPLSFLNDPQWRGRNGKEQPRVRRSVTGDVEYEGQPVGEARLCRETP